MRTTLLALIAFMLAGQAHAQVILLSENRSVSVSGGAQGYGAELQSYSQTQTPSAPFSDFNGNVSGSVVSTDAFPAYPPGPLFTYGADGQSRQTSAISSSEIAITGFLRGDEWIGYNTPIGGPPHGAASWMSSVFEVNFRVDTPIKYDLSSPSVWEQFQADDFSASSPYDVSLTSANNGVILNVGDFYRTSWFGPISGILQPDDYMLRVNVSVSLMPDPLGDMAIVEYGVKFTATPDSAPTALLLGIALAGLATLWRKVASARP